MIRATLPPSAQRDIFCWNDLEGGVETSTGFSCTSPPSFERLDAARGFNMENRTKADEYRWIRRSEESYVENWGVLRILKVQRYVQLE